MIVFLCLTRDSYAQENTRIIYVKLASQGFEGARTHDHADLSASDMASFPGVVSIAPLTYGGAKSGANGRVIAPVSKYLAGIQKIRLSESIDLETWLKTVRAYKNVIYAEPEQEVEILLTPNDPNVSNQTYLEKIEAYDAWNITQGDPNIVVAISDNGTDYDHIDLEDKLAFNTSDPVNGLDDDENGYIDDYLGWDVADSDNNPYGDTPSSNPSHGTLVAGIVAASTNNNEGMAGVGYHTSYLPIKVFKSSNGGSSNSYESIVYAADRGCEVINLSWGGVGFKSSALQDMISYAVLEKDMVVVAAAGNTNADLDFYPASYDYVLSVGMTDINDNKQAGATYSYKIDLMAPGGSIFSTANNDTYQTRSGSSFAAPQVAATAALVRDVFPDLNAIQVMEQVRMTSDDIYDVGSNSDYEGKLGKGRLNMRRAVSENEVGAIRSFNYSYSGPFGGLVFQDDTVVVDISFVNLLRPLENAKVNITSLSSYVEVLNNEIVLGDLQTFDSLKNIEINIRMKSDLPAEEKLGFRMDYSDKLGYDDFQYFEFTSAPDYIEMDNGIIELTVGSNGRLGYADDVLANGIGLKYNDERIANFMGIMVGNDPDSISDNIINSFSSFTCEDDLVSSRNIKYVESDDADYYSLGVISDDGADRIHGFLIEQEYLGWDDEDNNDFLLIEYRLTNTKDFDKDNMKFGLYMDFNLGDSTTNFVDWDAANKLAYTSSEEETDLLVGVALITDHSAIANAIDLFDQDQKVVDVPSDLILDDQFKYDLMNTEKTSAGGASGNDVAQLLTADLETFSAYGSEKIAYVIVFGEDLAELIANTNKAKSKYADFLNTPPLNYVVGTCEDEDLYLENDDPISVYSDVLGSDLIASGTQLVLGPFNDNTSLYYKEITGGYESDIYEMQVSIANPQINFSTTPEILYLGDNATNEVQFQDLSLGANQWSWDFDNGSFSSAKNPRTSFSEAGDYEISFTSTTDIGCTESMIRDYQVRERGDAPIIDDQIVCEGSAVSISASNSSALRFFYTQHSDDAFYEGSDYSISAINESVTYYVSSVASENESIKVPVNITVDPVLASFSYLPDTLDFSSASLIRIIDESTDASKVVWIINNSTQTGGDSFVYDYSGMSSVEITQEVQSDNGCESSLTKTVALTSSSKSGITAEDICEWEYVTAEPQYGDYFVFYDDVLKSNIIEKGKKVTFGPIRTDTSYFISNISNYLESELIEYEINVDEFQTKIIASPDSLYIDSDRNASFSIDNTSALSTEWIQDDGQKALVLAPTFTYQQAGQYLLTAISKNAGACLDTATMNYRVFQVLDADHTLQNLILFPNPTTDRLKLNSSTALRNLEVYHVNGTKDNIKINYLKDGALLFLDHLPSGVYFVQGLANEQVFRLKFVKK